MIFNRLRKFKNLKDNYFSSWLSKTPYISSLMNYVESGIIPFQCPGHKAGKAYEKQYKQFIKKNLFRLETNEIPLIDTFQNPTKSLKYSQEFMARAYGVYKTYYIVGGSTISNHIAIISTVCEKDKILVPRNSHKSVFSAIMLSGSIPVFLYPNYDYTYNIDCNISFDQIREVVEKNSISAVVINHPTYYGLVSEIDRISEFLDSKGILVIVDQAWGSHFRFHSSFPKCSTVTKSHLIVMSPHKTLFAFTQASVLHLNYSFVEKFSNLIPKIHQTVLMLNSTSPSPLLFLSLDYTQYVLNNKVEIFEKVFEICSYAINKLRRIDPEIVFDNQDKTKIVVNLSKYGLSGYELEQILLDDYGIQVELSDLFNILILVTVGDTKSSIIRFVNAISDIVKRVKKGILKSKGDLRKISEYPDWPELVISPRQAYISKTKELPIDRSIGRISAEIITTYPPGIPIIIPGERITKQIARYIDYEIDLGTKITGIYNLKEKKIRVVDE